MGVAAREPTMEDILASIRKIVSQDSASDPQRSDARPAAAAGSIGEPAIERRAPSPDASGVAVARDLVSRETGGSFANFAKSVAGDFGASAAPQSPPTPRWTPPRAPEPAIQSPTKAETAPRADFGQPHVGHGGSGQAGSGQAAGGLAGSGQADSGQANASAGTLSGVLRSVRQSWSPNEPIRREPARAAAAPKAVAAVEAMRAALASPSTDAAVSGSLERLKKGVIDNLDAKTEAMLKPMLREWLDEHLPKIVEKLVAAEIDRIARKS
jgi:cell pole-organizing protein PopZ